MSKILKKIRKIIVVDDAGKYPMAQRVIERSGISDIIYLTENEYNNFLAELPLLQSTEVVALKTFPGSFARKCPGTKEPYLCCEYEILSPVVNCPIGCSYCILQCYLNEPVNIIYVNVEKIFADAIERYKQFGDDKIIRVGTGELGDSLVFEEWTGMGEMLIDKFAGQKNIILELKTKSVSMGNILKKKSPGTPNPATICNVPDTRLERRRRVNTRQAFCNAVDGALQIAPAAKSNNSNFHDFGANAKNTENPINSNNNFNSFGLVDGFRGNIVLSWSLNPKEIGNNEEGIAAKVDERIEMAARAIERGYFVGFHFDPMIYHKNGKVIYGKVIKKLRAEINPEKIAWISLGTLRYPKEMPQIAKNNHPQSDIFSGEFIKGLDGKWRYPKPLRVEIYKWVADPLNEWSEDIFIYFCMELPDVWEKVFGWTPEDNEDFDKKFGESLKDRII